MSADGTYAPKSPDLSSFYDPGPTSSHPQIGAQVSQPLTGGGPQPLSQQQSQSQFSPQQLLHLQHTSSPYFPDAPRSTYRPQTQLQQSQHQLAASSHSLAQAQASSNAFVAGYSTRPQSTARQQQYYTPAESPTQPARGIYQTQSPVTVSPYFQSYGGTQYQQPHQPPQSQQQLQHQFSAQAQNVPQQQLAQAQQDQQQQLQILLRQQQQGSQQHYYSPSAPAGQTNPEPASPSQSRTMPPRRAAAQPPSPPVIDPSPVKTKFPTARIKRIMQADEEVGKVAQQTPIAVGKALELFMVQLVTKSADVAREKNSKRVSAQMLKQVVESDDQWDFLRDIVSRVENEDKAGKAGGRPKPESESEEEAPEKKKARPGRKKKA